MTDTDVSISSSPLATADPAPLLAATGVTKRFPGVVALDDVSLEVQAGEVHGLIGENGAGKSTLLKIVSGIYSADAGEFRVDGERVSLASPAEAARHGIEVIPQELVLAPVMSVAENILLGQYPSRGGRVRWREVRRRAEEIAARVGLRADVSTPVGELSVAGQRLTLIGRALAREARLLIMDEPTVALSEVEVEALMDVVRGLRADGVTIVYVSHRLDEVLALCDRVTVMKDGRWVATVGVSGVTKQRLVSLIVGRDLDTIYPDRSPRRDRDVRLRVRGLSGPRVRGIDFDLHRGEVLGIAGLVGSGRSRVVRMLFGAEPHDGGTIELDGAPLRIRHPRDAIRAGLAYLPEDRKAQGGILDMSVVSNMTLPVLRRFASARSVVRRRRERSAADEQIERLRVSPTDGRALMMNLSGGNQQKVLLGRWLMTGAKVFVFDEPTVGVDVGAKSEIYALIAGLAKSGASVLLVSSELEEIVGLCDRVLVMREGAIVGELVGERVTEPEILHLCFEVTTDEESHGSVTDA
jgi:ABC-type sugar transport system ATPase subunit